MKKELKKYKKKKQQNGFENFRKSKPNLKYEEKKN